MPWWSRAVEAPKSRRGRPARTRDSPPLSAARVETEPVAGARGGMSPPPQGQAAARTSRLREERVGVGGGRRRQRWTDWAVVAGLLALSFAFYTPLSTSNRIAYDFDIWAFFYPLRQYAADALRDGRFPLWNPDIFLGSPFYANAQTALLYPLNLVFLVLPVPAAYSVS